MGTNEVRYVAELEVDQRNPWQWRDGPDAVGRARKVIQFRLLPVGAVEPYDAESLLDVGASTTAEPAASPPPAPEATEIEALRRPEFLRLTTAREQIARREELQLVHTFRRWMLTAHDVVATGLRIHTAIGASPLRADLFIPSRRILVEAKASAAREHLRTAIGQLLDYGRYLEPPVTLCVLTPTRPADDMLSLLGGLKIAAAWPDGRTFVITPASLLVV